MPHRKMKYYEVHTTQVISAKNKTDAIAKARRRPHVEAEVLGTFVDADRISAVEARDMVTEPQVAHA